MIAETDTFTDSVSSVITRSQPSQATQRCQSGSVNIDWTGMFEYLGKPPSGLAVNWVTVARSSN